MNFPAHFFPVFWAYGAFAPLGWVLWRCIRYAPWRRLAEDGQLNVWFGAIVTLMLFWRMSAGAWPGLNLHILGATAFTLMFGRRLAILGFTIVMVAITLNGGAGWDAFALNVLVMAVLPSYLAELLLTLTERYLPANFFVYVFCAAFFGAGLATLLTGLFSSTLMWLAGIYPAEKIFVDYFPFFLLLGFAEAWLNGAAITLMTVYYPRWVGSFDDKRYLSAKK